MADEAEGASGTDPAPEAVDASPAEDDGGQAEATTDFEAAAQAAESSETPGSDTFTVKVDGEELDVSLEELQQGYMRQADYTRKTQDVAETQRRVETLDRFEAALDADPEGTIKELLDAYGVDLGNTAQPSDADESDSGEPLTDAEKRIAALEAEIEAQKQAQLSDAEAQAMAQIDADLEKLKVDNDDPDLDESAVLQIAVDRNIGDLDAAYLLYRRENPRAESTPKPPPKVEGGSNVTTPAPGGDKKMTIEQAMEAAERALSGN